MPTGVVDIELDKVDVIDWIRTELIPDRLIASVCTDAFLLAKPGKLAGKRVTTHREDIDDLKAMLPSLDVLSAVRWVDEDSFVTSAGI